MDDTTSDDRSDEVVAEFDQTNGKAPGLDRCGDVLTHAHYMAIGPNGGALLFVGHDTPAQPSPLPSDPNAPLADAGGFTYGQRQGPFAARDTASHSAHVARRFG